MRPNSSYFDCSWLLLRTEFNPFLSRGEAEHGLGIHNFINVGIISLLSWRIDDRANFFFASVELIVRDLSVANVILINGWVLRG